jgi:fucose 4-O-acetylase-like acetyltransferase
MRGEQRLDAVDYLKAAAIVAVVFTHSGVFLFSPAATAWDRWLTGSWIWFHVPTFLLVSGFLYARSSGVDLAQLRRRFARLLLPYVVASLVMQATGVARVESPGAALHQIATGSALGHYYFVPVLALCILLVWPLSRLRRSGVVLLLAGALVYALACAIAPGLTLTTNRFWAARNPLESFFLGYFLLGWLAALLWPTLTRLAERWRIPLLLACAGGVALWFYGMGGRFPVQWVVLTRALYTVGVTGLILAATRGRPAPRPVRFLSDATLVIFLYHSGFVLTTYSSVAGWSPPLRILFQAALGLAGGSAVALAARKLLGPHQARRWFGA